MSYHSELHAEATYSAGPTIGYPIDEAIFVVVVTERSRQSQFYSFNVAAFSTQYEASKFMIGARKLFPDIDTTIRIDSLHVNR